MARTNATDREIIREAKDRFEQCVTWESMARVRQMDDTKFYNGDSYNGYQWPNKLYSDRLGQDKPALTINKVRQHCLQIINDARQNKASVRVRAVGGGATYQAAQVFEGLIRHIEYQSNAMTAYDKATWDQVIGGIGYWRITTDYVDADSFDQEIYVRRVPDPRSVYLDPDIQQFDGSDARFGFVFTDVPNDKFEADYPRFKALASAAGMNTGDPWNTESHTRVAEYYRRSMVTDTLFAMSDGMVVRASEYAGTELLTRLREDKTIQRRRITEPQIEWYKIAADQIIDRGDWAGAYIPIVRVVGEETVIDGQLDRKGHVRAMIDAQRMYNYWTSCAVEFGALQSKAPYIAAAEAIEGREEVWADANLSNPAVLTYNGFDEHDRPVPKPERQQPPVASQAYMSGMTTAAQEIMSVSGQYQAELGMPSNERSGVAIQERQRQGDNATYHFIDHLAVAIRYAGRQLIDLIPKVYDVKRVVRIMAEDGTDAEVTIDPDANQAHQAQPAPGAPPPTSPNVFKIAETAKLVFNPNVGRYDVESDVGPNFGTQRQEAFNAFTQIASQNPALMDVIGDIMFKNADFPGADEIAERFSEQRSGATVPAAHFQQVMQQGSEHIKQLQGLLQQTAEALADERKKSADAAAKLEIDDYRAETERMNTVAKIDPAALLPLIRKMVSEVMGEPALPHIAAHQAANAAMQPGDTDPMAVLDMAHRHSMDRTLLMLDAHQQGHDQAMDVAAQRPTQ